MSKDFEKFVFLNHDKQPCLYYRGWVYRFKSKGLWSSGYALDHAALPHLRLKKLTDEQAAIYGWPFDKKPEAEEPEAVPESQPGNRERGETMSQAKTNEEPRDIIEQIKRRRAKLHPYTNSKELNHLHHLLRNIEAGLDAAIGAKAFLELVPEGEYDSDRGGYSELIRSELNRLENHEQGL